ncbi:DUF4062 domain-containing protein [Vibrio cholerae]|uniref:DUF4062 domain-containing protein n=1 Tax=Vibrio cholerae TaxID=666 RepID=UPI0001BAD833|nr:DUF4062 domain-containing protein [Vibrio cholerae]EEY50685.1 hypothetical protein VIH_002378 [Vibrio cholerae CT 5369-93]ELT6289708.1 DUF4062 domain-containing protein [Vibrio cholerae]MBJ6934240.1 DUF4062 domain-containing protein [Vibrio cholerae]
MAKPRIFISSTYYDLKHIRNAIESFVDGFGYDSVLFESGDIPFSHHDPLDESCYKEIETCHMLVLIVGGRYGSTVSSDEQDMPQDELEKHYHHFNSITKKEYETAKKLDLPIYIFLEKGVAAEYQTYKENRDNVTIKYAHVDSVNVFRLLDSIYSLNRNNLVREFEKFDDISFWLREQWAGLFANYLSRRTAESNLKSLSRQLSSLENVANALKDYSESLIKNVSPNDSEKIISETNEKLQHNRDLELFRANRFIEHLVERHRCEIDELFSIFLTSKTLSSFGNNLQEIFPEGERCGAFRTPRAINELNELREYFKLPLFKSPAVKRPKSNIVIDNE